MGKFSNRENITPFKNLTNGIKRPNSLRKIIKKEGEEIKLPKHDYWKMKEKSCVHSASGTAHSPPHDGFVVYRIPHKKNYKEKNKLRVIIFIMLFVLSETKGMITIMKRIICAAIAVLVVMLGVFGMSPSRVQAYTSAKQVKKEISTVNKKISQATQASKKAKAKYKSLAAKDKAETAGSYLLLLAKIQNTNPFIVSTGGRYYRVLNPSNGTTLLGHYTASIRSAGGSTYYSGLSCTNVTAVKSSVDAKLTQARREMSKQDSLRESLINKKNKLKKTLTYRVPSKKIVMEMGDARSLSALCKNKYFNKVTWKSSNTSVVRIKNGKLRAVKAGNTILTAKTSISRKTTKISVTVKGVGIISTSLDKSELQLTAGQSAEVGFKYDYDEEESYAVESGVSSNESVATVSMKETVTPW